MPLIKLQTQIQADKKIVFDLSRSIDLHKLSATKTNETAIAGVTSGLIGLNETVTWRAKHFGFYQELTTKITEFDYPNHFTDEMVSGTFKSFKHEHHFEDMNGGTLMIDTFNYQSPFGVLGRFADKLFLNNYMTDFLKERNRIIKEFAESERWEEVLDTKP